MPVTAARTLLLQGLGLLDDPTCSTSDAIADIERLGFVQLDSINIVERAHHHILWTRRHSYRPDEMETLQARGDIFEHWTHDASVIPTRWFPHWKNRFSKVAWDTWLRHRMGPRYRKVLNDVLERVRTEGPLSARDFENPNAKSGAWWDWKPAKAALEYWWRSGELAVPRRVGFEKVYDLTSRVLPHVHDVPAPCLDEHTEWACRGALERLGVATPREIAGFWGLLTVSQAAKWCAAAAARGEVITARVEGTPASRVAFALPNWRTRVEEVSQPHMRMRLISPFDPLIRDRARCELLFSFSYRFEAFVPEGKRRHGYYVLPILRGDRLIGRLDPKFDRSTATLLIRGVWWEPSIRPSRALRKELELAVSSYCEFLGATNFALDACVMISS